jgi:hypothetical protein
MKPRIAALVLAGGAVASAAALNKIVEWGGHVQDEDYSIRSNPEYGDYAVLITGNPHPETPWKFRAYDDETRGLGFIQYIEIESGAIGSIHLSVVGLWPHAPGATWLGSVDLATHGDPENPNVIDEIVIEGNFGEWGAMLAHDIGNVAIGGTLLNDITCRTLGDVTIGGGIAPNPVPKIELGSTGNPSDYSHTLDVTGLLPQIIIHGNVTGTITSTEGAADSVTVFGALAEQGSITVQGNLPDALIDGPIDPSAAFTVTGYLGIANSGLGLTVEGDAQGTIDIGFVSGRLRVAGAVPAGGSLLVRRYVLGLWPDGGVEVERSVEGTVRVEEDLQGRLCLGYGETTTSSVGPNGLVEVLGKIDVAGMDNGLLFPNKVEGRVHVGGDVWGPITCAGREALSGQIEIDGALGRPEWGSAQLVFFGGDASGAVRIHGTVYNAIDVVGNLLGHIHCASMLGLIDLDGDLGDRNTPNDQTFKGHIRIDGMFEPFGHITVGGQIVGATSFIAVDYDANGDDWVYVDDEAGAIVVIEGDPLPTIYRGNTPDAQAAHVWEISECKGDLDGDGTVGFPDINPFILALTNPLGYSQYYPGLGCTGDPNDPDCLAGSRIWHGDLNCDGSLDFSDINPFVALLTNPCCQASCDPCPGGDGGLPGLSPEELAAQLAANIWPELYPDLVAMVAAMIDAAPDEETQAYWQAVYEALTQ